MARPPLPLIPPTPHPRKRRGKSPCGRNCDPPLKDSDSHGALRGCFRKRRIAVANARLLAAPLSLRYASGCFAIRGGVTGGPGGAARGRGLSPPSLRPPGKREVC